MVIFRKKITVQKIINLARECCIRVIRKFNPARASLIEIKETAIKYNMFTESNEVFYAKLYMNILTAKIDRCCSGKKLSILDLGCGQGRLSIPLARLGHTVTGVDLTDKCIKQARCYARDNNVKVDFIVSELSNYINSESREFDCIVCTEVLYMLPGAGKILKRLSEMLKEGGLLFVSVRPKMFYISYWLKHQNIEYAQLALNASSGFFGTTEFNWFTEQELIGLMESISIRKVQLYGIGVVSGIKGDPQSSIALPSTLNESDGKILFDIEMKLSGIYRSSGRYILACGQKNKEAK